MADNTETLSAVPVLLSQISATEKAQQYATQAAELSDAAAQAISFTKKTWTDTETSGTPITAADLNRIEQAISDLNTNITSLQDSLSQTPSLTSYVSDLSGSHVTRVGTTCYIRLYLRVTQGFAANSSLTMLPEAYRPSEPVFVTALVTKAGETTVGHGDVMADGTVTIPSTMASGDVILLWGAWAVEP